MAETCKPAAETGRPKTRVSLKIDPARVQFKSADALHKGRLKVTVIYADTKGHDLGSDWRAIDIEVQEDVYREILKWGIPFSTTVPLKMPKQVLKVVVFDPASGRIGSKFIKVK